MHLCVMIKSTQCVNCEREFPFKVLKNTSINPQGKVVEEAAVTAIEQPRNEQPGGRAARGTSSPGDEKPGGRTARGASSQGTSSQRTSSRGTSSQGVTGYSSQIYNIDRKTRLWVGQLSETFPGSPNTRSKLLFRVQQSAVTLQQAANHV